MKKLSFHLLIALATMLLPMVSCNSSPAPVNFLPPAQDTAVPGNIDNSTEAPTVAPTDTEYPTVVPTNTEYPTPLPTQPLCTHTNDISVPLSSSGCIEVARNSDLTISSTDGKAHTCTFNGKKNVTVSIPQGQNSSPRFQLVGFGDYTLTCLGSPTSVKIK